MAGYDEKAFRRDVKELAGLLSALDGQISRAAKLAGKIAGQMDGQAEAEGSERRVFGTVDESFGMLERARGMLVSALTGGDLT